MNVKVRYTFVFERLIHGLPKGCILHGRSIDLERACLPGILLPPLLKAASHPPARLRPLRCSRGWGSRCLSLRSRRSSKPSQVSSTLSRRRPPVTPLPPAPLNRPLGSLLRRNRKSSEARQGRRRAHHRAEPWRRLLQLRRGLPQRRTLPGPVRACEGPGPRSGQGAGAPPARLLPSRAHARRRSRLPAASPVFRRTTLFPTPLIFVRRTRPPTSDRPRPPPCRSAARQRSPALGKRTSHRRKR